MTEDVREHAIYLAGTMLFQASLVTDEEDKNSIIEKMKKELEEYPADYDLEKMDEVHVDCFQRMVLSRQANYIKSIKDSPYFDPEELSLEGISPKDIEAYWKVELDPKFRVLSGGVAKISAVRCLRPEDSELISRMHTRRDKLDKHFRLDETVRDKIESIVLPMRRLDALYYLSERLSEFGDYVEQLKDKAKNLESRGYGKESAQATALAEKLSDLKDQLIRADIAPRTFAAKTTALVQEAKDHGLANLRGAGRIFYPILNVIRNMLTCLCTLGFANVATGRISIFSSSSDTGKKLDELEQEANNFSTIR